MGLGCVLRGWGGEGGAAGSSYEGEHEVIFFFNLPSQRSLFLPVSWFSLPSQRLIRPQKHLTFNALIVYTFHSSDPPPTPTRSVLCLLLVCLIVFPHCQ